MSTPLAEFFAQMRPYLLGVHGLPQVREALGPSPSGDDDFAFYRVLAERNLFKILREIYGPVRALVSRERDADHWRALVRAYVQAHPPTARHPNGFGEAFPAFLEAQREDDPSQPELWEEIADFCWIRVQVAGGPDEEGDGFDRRLFVRQYTHPVPDLVGALDRDPDAELPEARPIVVLVYRHYRSLQTRLFQPSAAGLVALARRQGAPVPEALRSIPVSHVEQADTELVAHGVLCPQPATPRSP